MVKRETYDVRGMRCAGCAAAVERAVGKVGGVVGCEVNLPMGRLTVWGEGAGGEGVIRAVEGAGFSAERHVEKGAAVALREAEAEEAAAGRGWWGLGASLVLAGLLLGVSMGPMVVGGGRWPGWLTLGEHPVWVALLELGLCVPVLVLGRRFFTGGMGALWRGNPNMDTLVALSAGTSFLYSLGSTVGLGCGHFGGGLYYESAAVVVALVGLGKQLEARTQVKTKEAIRRLMRLTPETAWVEGEDGELREVGAGGVGVGEVVWVKAGERVPLDGVVIGGTGSVNEAMLTGESLPVEKGVGAEVIGGSVSVGGALRVRVTRVGADTTLAKIIRFVEEAQGKKAPISKVADRVAGFFVPLVMGIAVVAGGIWLWQGAGVGFALKIFTCVLVIACPCAMGLATPTAILSGTGLGAAHGILVRSGEALEATARVGTVLLDKTGTVTVGEPGVTDVVGGDAGEVLRVAWVLERFSAHPLAAAICAEAEARGVAGGAGGEGMVCREEGGRGLCGLGAGGEEWLAGNMGLMEGHGVEVGGEGLAAAARLRGEGKTVVFVARGGRLLGLLGLADTIKADAAEAVGVLRGMGLRTVLVTGDNREAAEYIGRLAGVDEVEAEVLPTEKAGVVQRYQAGGCGVMMVGDGINDAPALTQADVGCAIGTGSDIAIDSADIVLMKSGLMDVARAIRLGRMTLRNVKENLLWAFCYNVVGIPVAAGALYPVLGLLLSPMIGGLAMSLSSLCVVSNALRLKGKKL